MGYLRQTNNYTLQHVSNVASVNVAKSVMSNGAFITTRLISGLITNTDSSKEISVVVYYSDYSDSFENKGLYSATLHPNETINIFSKDMPFVLGRAETLFIKFTAESGCDDLRYYFSFETFSGGA